MSDLKFHIILPYYKRQKIVSNALTSILKSNYQNWFLTLIDDSGNRGFEEVFSSYGFDTNKSEYINIGINDEEKKSMGGSKFGYFINEAIKRIESDIIIILCDDDALVYDYMTNLNDYYINNPTVLWSYCHLLFYNPNEHTYKEAIAYDGMGRLNFLNDKRIPINPQNLVDSSQVSFRRNTFIDNNVWFPFPKTANLDAAVFGEMYDKIGECPFNNIMGQCKASFIDQLGLRISNRQGEYIKL